MDRKPVVVFLIKVVPLFAVLLYLWHARGFSGGYHGLVAGFLYPFYPHLGPTGVFTGITADWQHFTVGLLIHAKTASLNINANDITSNFVLLIALYFASPIRESAKVFCAALGGAVVALFLVHGATVVTCSLEALMTHPAIIASSPFNEAETFLIPRYNVFYEEMGMYLVVLVLWFPYILWRILGVRGQARKSAAA